MSQNLLQKRRRPQQRACAATARPGLVVAFNADERAPYRAVATVLEQLKQANAVHVSFTSEPRPRGTKTN